MWNRELGRRLREVRVERCGEAGLAEFAGVVGVPIGSWDNYERGVVVPGHILLRFIDVTGVCVRWLLTGQPPRYEPAGAERTQCPQHLAR
jgi:hypothetical protein